MKIGQVLNFNSKGLEKAKSLNFGRNNNIVPNENNNKVTPSADTLKAYANTNTLSGIKNAIVKADNDAFQLIYNIKSPYSNTEKIKVLYTVRDEETQREAFSSFKNTKNNSFRVEIPVLDRKTNKVIEKIKIDGVEYFNDANVKTNDESLDNMIINPKNMLSVNETRKAVINGESTVAEMDSISEGAAIGRLVEKDYEEMVRYKGTEPIIVILSQADMEALFIEISEGTFTLPMNVKGLIASPEQYKQGDNLTDCLGHAVSRLRGRKTFTLVDSKTLNKIKSNFLNNEENPFIKIESGVSELKVSGLRELPKTDEKKVEMPKNVFVNELLTPQDKDFTQETVGLKAYNLGKLQKLQTKGNFKVPSFFVVPAGVWNYTKTSEENADIYNADTSSLNKVGNYNFYVQKADSTDNPSVELNGIRYLITNDLIIPKDVRTKLKNKVDELFDIKRIKNNGCLIARSSFNGEDSDIIATQGLYDSFPGIRTEEQLYRGIKGVWASKWSDLAYMSRRNHKIPHNTVEPNVIIQEVVPVDYTFTINTADPRSNDKNKIVCQLSQGVYSGFPNSPYIFEYDKTTGEIKRTALATKKRTKSIDKIKMDDTRNEEYDMTDYSNDPLNMSKKYYAKTMKKVFDVAKFIEQNFDGKPQDIEGGIIFKQNPETKELEPEIHIWQTRDVHLIKR